MSLDELILILSKIEVKNIITLFEIPKSIEYSLRHSKVGTFEIHLKEDVAYISSFLFEMFNIQNDDTCNLLEVLQGFYHKDQQFEFLQLLESHLQDENQDELSIKFKTADLHWVEISYKKDNDILYGSVRDIHLEEEAKMEIYSQNIRMFKVFNNIPIPVYFYDANNNLNFNNNKEFKDHALIYSLIEKSLEDNNKMTETDLVDSFQILKDEDNQKKFKIEFSDGFRNTIIIVHRIIINIYDNYYGKLYIYEDVTRDYTNNNKLNKILQASELTIAIKDVVDEINDITELYDFFLNKLNTVIPDVKRACILRLDQAGKLNMVAKYGFIESYADNFDVSFEDSFACQSFNGDYSKSIIINDVQKMFASIHPDINKNQSGFKLESNMIAPIVLNGKLYGLLSVDSDSNNVFDEVDLHLIDYIRIQVERSILKFRNFAQVKRHSIIDPLTGIYNRRHLEKIFNDYIDNVISYDENLAIVLFDIDDLKVINDYYGHIAGDNILKAFSEFAYQEIRDVDTIARYGGDEFVAIFQDISVSDLEKKLNNWKVALVDSPVMVDKNSLIVRFSFGISSYPSESNNFDQLIDIADKRMYEQKRKK